MPPTTGNPNRLTHALLFEENRNEAAVADEQQGASNPSNGRGPHDGSSDDDTKAPAGASNPSNGRGPHDGSSDDEQANPLAGEGLPASLERSAFGIKLEGDRGSFGADGMESFALPPELRDPPTLVERAQELLTIPDDIPRKSLYQYGLLMVYMVCPMLGILLPMPLMIFAQTKFFNGGSDCVTAEQTDSPGCRAAMASVNEVQSITYFIQSMLSLFLAPVIGRISDSIGRRRVMIYSLIPSFLQNLCLFLWAVTDGAVPLWGYFACYTLPTSFCWIMGNAFVADIFPGRHRATFFSFTSAMWSLTNVWASALAGMFETITWTSCLAFVFQAVGMAWAWFMLPETLPDSERRVFDWRQKGELAKVMNAFTQMKIVNRNSIFRRLALTLLFSSCCSRGFWNLQIPYLRQVLDFTKDNFVTLNEIGGAGGLFVQVLLTPWLIAKAGEKSTVIVGLSVYIVYMAMYATETVHDPTGAYVNSLIQDVSNVNYPAISSIKSTLSAGNEQGQILGAISAIQSLASGIGPAIFQGLFSVSLEEGAPFRPSFVWWVGIFIMGTAVLLAFTVPDPRHARAEQERAKAEAQGLDPPPPFTPPPSLRVRVERWTTLPPDIPRRAYKLYAMLMVYQIVNILGFSLPSPLLIFAQTKFFNDNHDCITPEQTETKGCTEAVGRVAETMASASFVQSIMSLWLSPVIGRVSDSIGRRKVMALSMLPNFFQYGFLSLWAVTNGGFSFWFYYAASAVPSFSFTMGNAYVADIMPGKYRATFFSFNSAVFSLVSIPAAAIAGMFDHIMYPAILAFSCQVIGLLWALFAITETLPDDERRPFDWKDKTELMEVANAFKQMKIVNRNPIFRRLALTLLLSSACSYGMYNLQTVYFRQELEFTKDNYVTYSEIYGAGGLVVQVLITPWLINKFGEKSALIFGLFVYIIYMANYGFGVITNPQGAYVNSLIQDVSRVNYPAISSIKSTLSAGNEQGQILGAISAIQSMAGGVGPFIFATLYDISLGENAPFPPRFIWLVGCFIMAGSVAMAFTVPDPRIMRDRQNRWKAEGLTALQIKTQEAEHTRLKDLRRMERYARKSFGSGDQRHAEIYRRLIAHVQKMQRRGSGNNGGGNVGSHAALLSLSVEGTAASASWRSTHGPRKG